MLRRIRRALLILPLCAGAALAQPPAGDEGAEPDTPRRTVERFLSHARAGRYAEAAKELDLSVVGADKGPLLARRLREVLDQRLALDPDKISDVPAGDLRDGLAEDMEEIGRVPGPGGREAVRLRRTAEGQWLFSRPTVNRVQSWWGRLEDRWLRELLPEPLWRSGPKGILLWQWLALPIVLALCYTLAILLVWLARRPARAVARRTRWRWDDLLTERLGGAGRLMVAALLAQLCLEFLYLSSRGEQFLDAGLRALFLLGLFVALWRTVRVLTDAARESAWVRTHPSAVGMIPLGERLAQITLVALGLVVTLQQIGFQVTSLLAGLGIGGLGIALAAQKTVEHLFGGLMLSADQPMRVGDFVKIDTLLGTVEHIGMRSTRIRTLDRTVVSIPNGKLADMNIETFAARDRIRLALTLGVTYDTRAAQLRAILADAEALLRGHPLIWPDEVIVRFASLGASSLDIEIMCWFRTANFNAFRAIRQEVLLGLLEVVERHGSAVAFPTRTVHLLGGASGPPGVPDAGGTGARPAGWPRPGEPV